MHVERSSDVIDNWIHRLTTIELGTVGIRYSLSDHFINHPSWARAAQPSFQFLPATSLPTHSRHPVRSCSADAAVSYQILFFRRPSSFPFQGRELFKVAALINRSRPICSDGSLPEQSYITIDPSKSTNGGKRIRLERSISLIVCFGCF